MSDLFNFRYVIFRSDVYNYKVVLFTVLMFRSDAIVLIWCSRDHKNKL